MVGEPLPISCPVGTRAVAINGAYSCAPETEEDRPQSSGEGTAPSIAATQPVNAAAIASVLPPEETLYALEDIFGGAIPSRFYIAKGKKGDGGFEILQTNEKAYLETGSDRVIFGIIRIINGIVNNNDSEVLTSDTMEKINSDPDLKAKLQFILISRTKTANFEKPELASHQSLDETRVGFASQDAARRVENSVGAKFDRLIKLMREGDFNVEIGLSTDRDNQITGYEVFLKTGNIGETIAIYKKPTEGSQEPPLEFNITTPRVRAAIAYLQILLEGAGTGLGYMSYNPGTFDVATASSLRNFLMSQKEPFRINLEQEQRTFKAKQKRARQTFEKVEIARRSKKFDPIIRRRYLYEKIQTALGVYRDLLAKAQQMIDGLPLDPKNAEFLRKCRQAKSDCRSQIRALLYEILGIKQAGPGLIDLDFTKLQVSIDQYYKRPEGNRKQAELREIMGIAQSLQGFLDNCTEILRDDKLVAQGCEKLKQQARFTVKSDKKGESRLLSLDQVNDYLFEEYPEKVRNVEEELAQVDGENAEALYAHGKRDKENPDTLTARIARARNLSNLIGSGPIRDTITSFLYRAYRKKRKDIPLEILFQDFKKIIDQCSEEQFERLGESFYASEVIAQQKGLEGENLADATENYDDAAEDASDTVGDSFEDKKDEKKRQREMQNLFYMLYAEIEFYNAWARKTPGEHEVRFKEVAQLLFDKILPQIKAYQKELESIPREAFEAEIAKTFEPLTQVSPETELAATELAIMHDQQTTRLASKDWRLAKITTKGKDQIQGLSYDWNIYSISGQINGKDVGSIKFAEIRSIEFKTDGTAIVTTTRNIKIVIANYQILVHGILPSDEFPITREDASKTPIAFTSMSTIVFAEPPRVNMDNALVVSPRVLQKLEEKNAEVNVLPEAYAFEDIQRYDPEQAERIRASMGGAPGKHYLVSFHGGFKEVTAEDIASGKVKIAPIDQSMGVKYTRKIAEFLLKEKIGVIQLARTGRKGGSSDLRFALSGEVQTWFKSQDLASVAGLFSKGKFYFKPGTLDLKPIQVKILTIVRDTEGFLTEEESELLDRILRSSFDRYFEKEEIGQLKDLIEKIDEGFKIGLFNLSIKDGEERILKETLPYLSRAVEKMVFKDGLSNDEAAVLREMSDYMHQYDFVIADYGLSSRIPSQEILKNIPPGKIEAFMDCYAKTIEILERIHAQLFLMASKYPPEEYEGKSARDLLGSYLLREDRPGEIFEAMGTTIKPASSQESEVVGLPNSDIMLLRMLLHPELLANLREAQDKIRGIDEEIEMLISAKADSEELGISAFQSAYTELEGFRKDLDDQVRRAQDAWDKMDDLDQEEIENHPLNLHLRLLRQAQDILLSLTASMKNANDDPNQMLRMADDIRLTLLALRKQLETRDPKMDSQYGGVLGKVLIIIKKAEEAAKQVIEKRGAFSQLLDQRTDWEIKRQSIMDQLTLDEFSAADYQILREKLNNNLLGDNWWIDINRQIQKNFTGELSIVYGANLRDSGKTPVEILDDFFASSEAQIDLSSTLPIGGESYERTMAKIAINKIIQRIPREAYANPLAILPALLLSGRGRMSSPHSLGLQIPAAIGRLTGIEMTYGASTLQGLEERANSPFYMTAYSIASWAANSSDQKPKMNLSSQLYMLLMNTRQGTNLIRERYLAFDGTKELPFEQINTSYIPILLAYAREEILPRIEHNPRLRDRLQYLFDHDKIRGNWLKNPPYIDLLDQLIALSQENRTFTLFDASNSEGREKALAMLVEDLLVISGEINKTRSVEDPENTPITYFDPGDTIRQLYQMAEYEGDPNRAEESPRKITLVRYGGRAARGETPKDEIATHVLLLDYPQQDIPNWADARVAALVGNIEGAFQNWDSFSDAALRQTKGVIEGYEDAFARLVLFMQKGIILGWPSMAKGLIKACEAAARGDYKTAREGVRDFRKAYADTAGAFFVFEVFGFIFLQEVLTDLENERYGQALAKFHLIQNRFLKHQNIANIATTVTTALKRGWIEIKRGPGTAIRLVFRRGGRQALRAWQAKKARTEFNGLGEKFVWKTTFGLPELLFADPAAWIDRMLVRRSTSLGMDISVSGFDIVESSAYNPTSARQRSTSETIVEFGQDTVRWAENGVDAAQQKVADKVEGVITKTGKPSAVSPTAEAIEAARIRLDHAARNPEAEFKVEFNRGAQGEGINWGGLILDRETYLRLAQARSVDETAKIIEEFNRNTDNKYKGRTGTPAELHDNFAPEREAYQQHSTEIEAVRVVSPTSGKAAKMQAILEGLSGTGYFTEYTFTLESGDISLKGWQIKRILEGKEIRGVTPEQAAEIRQEFGTRGKAYDRAEALQRAGRDLKRYSVVDIFRGYGIEVDNPSRFERMPRTRLARFAETCAERGATRVNASGTRAKAGIIMARAEMLLGQADTAAVIASNGGTIIVSEEAARIGNGNRLVFKAGDGTVLRLSRRTIIKSGAKAAGTALILSGVLTIGGAIAAGRDLKDPSTRIDLYKQIGIGTGVGTAFMTLDKGLQLLGYSQVRSMGLAGAVIGTAGATYDQWDRLGAIRDGHGWVALRGALNVGVEGAKGAASAVVFAYVTGESGGLMIVPAMATSSGVYMGLSALENTIAEETGASSFFNDKELAAQFAQKGIKLELRGGGNDHIRKIAQSTGNSLMMGQLLKNNEPFRASLLDAGIVRISADSSSDINYTLMPQLVDLALAFKEKHGRGQGISISLSSAAVHSYSEGKIVVYSIKISNGKQESTTIVRIPIEGDPIAVAQRLWMEEHRDEIALIDLTLLKVGVKYKELERYPKIKQALDVILPEGNGSYEQRVNAFLDTSRETNYFDSAPSRIQRKAGYLSPSEAYALLCKAAGEDKVRQAIGLRSQNAGVTTIESSPAEIAAELNSLANRLDNINQTQGLALIALDSQKYDPDIASVQRALYKLGLIKIDEVTGFSNDATIKAVHEFTSIHYPSAEVRSPSFDGANIDILLLKALTEALEISSERNWKTAYKTREKTAREAKKQKPVETAKIKPAPEPDHFLLPLIADVAGNMWDRMMGTRQEGKLPSEVEGDKIKEQYPQDSLAGRIKDKYGIKKILINEKITISEGIKNALNAILDRYQREFDEIYVEAEKDQVIKIRLKNSSSGREVVWYAELFGGSGFGLLKNSEGYQHSGRTNIDRITSF